MSFAFQFDEADTSSPSAAPTQPTSSAPQAAFQSHTLASLLSSLPARLSYSLLQVGSHTLLRRDLFDARFQMLLDDDTSISASSDLVPGVYEGGLKTWECASDLVSILDSRPDLGREIVELGCGTAVPSLFVLSRLFGEEKPVGGRMHLCDYNEQVLRLVTLPNLLLTWWASDASKPFRDSDAYKQALEQEQHEIKRRGQDHFSAETGELTITEDMVNAFLASLEQHDIQILLYSGSWAGLQLQTDRPLDLVLTAETIYSLDTIPLLVGALQRILSEQTLCLVGAKVLYFGVGGGVEAFKQLWKGTTETLLTVSKGVGRVVLSVRN